MHRGWVICLSLSLSSVGFAQSGNSASLEISGRVLNGATGESVPRALVEINGRSFQPLREGQNHLAPQPTFTDASGVFRFVGLSSGPYDITVSRPQFVAGHETVQLTSSGKVVEISLARLAVVTGTVIDAEGQPIRGVNVVLSRVLTLQGRRTLQQSRSVITDDRGQYRLWNIGAGSYVLKAAGRGRGTMLYSTQALPSFSASESFVPIYFGGSTDWRTATLIKLASGSEVKGDFRLPLQPVRKIRGAVTGMTLFRNATFELFDQQDNLVATRAALSGAGGQFQLLDVLAGSYTVRVKQGAGAAQVFGEAQVTVGDEDATGVSIPLRPGVDVSVVSEECRLGNTEAKVPCGSLVLHGFDGQEFSKNTFRNVPPGGYEFQASSFGHYVSSVLVGGRAVRPTERIQASEGMGPIEIQVAKDGASLEMSLEIPGSERPTDVQALVVPVFENFSGPVQTWLGPDQSVKYAPGEYTIYALRRSDLDELEYRNPEALRGLTPSATIKVEPNGHHKVAIRNLSK
jgi:protocatechuate 3,4-dioxygenase beta subunit